MGLVVVEDLGHRNHTRILRSGVRVAPGFSLVPIQDAPHEGGDQSDAGFGTGNGLTETKQEGEVAVNPLFLQHLGGFDAFPGGSNFDQNPIVADAGIVVQTNQLAPFFNRGVGVKTQASIHLR